ncbi:MAG: hypothetical protein ACYTEQ_29970 [Planctomycetota bacterium]
MRKAEVSGEGEALLRSGCHTTKGTWAVTKTPAAGSSPAIPQPYAW